jgi:phospholipid transport system substrate-binding protein
MKTVFTGVLVSLSLLGGVAFAQVTPDAQVKAVTGEVTALLKADPSIPSSPTKLASVIEGKLAPNFNFTRMTQLAMGRNWAKASPEQQLVLTGEFKNLLVRTYSGALSNYRNNSVDFKPVRMQPSDTDVIVKTLVQSGGSPIPIDYNMEKAGDSWKAYDVTVGGVRTIAKRSTTSCAMPALTDSLSNSSRKTKANASIFIQLKCANGAADPRGAEYFWRTMVAHRADYF